MADESDQEVFRNPHAKEKRKYTKKGRKEGISISK